jgi:hypothetical protein
MFWPWDRKTKAPPGKGGTSEIVIAPNPLSIQEK